MGNLNKVRAVCLSVGLLFVAVGCGDSDSDADAGREANPTEAPADSTMTNSTESETTAGDTGSGNEATNCDDDYDADNLSTSATVLFSADVDSGQTDDDITDATTIVIAADGTSMEPADFTIPVNTMFGVELSREGQLDQIVIGCADGQTAPVGIVVGFMITEPGEYPVTLDLQGTRAGTITVE